ncbi:metalloregulator ArsR/SmtB family transcription factor [Vibrio profundum]|uniref:metalloregulator ArsR/SmtB family transcription factor n=1 Tax=Vibrio profundum TaxID=2910247 RepID=UPI003D0FC962
MQPLIFFKCLSDDTRLKMLLLLSKNGELCVCDLQAALQVSQPKVSRHLAELRRCELLEDERRGKWVYYRLSPQLPEWMSNTLQDASENSANYLDECVARLEQCAC